MKTAKKFRALCLAGAALQGLCSAAYAQEAASTPGAPSVTNEASSASAEEGVASEEIIITAQKRAERISDVPVSVSAVSGERLQNLGVTSIDDLTSIVPNLQSSGIIGEGTPIFSLRGVSMSDYSLNQSSPVATYYDEVYKGNFALLGVAMYDLERVEVLRGPQGTLYGKNTTGGAVNLITRRPRFETEGNFSVGYGNYDRFEADGAIQAPLSETVAARLAFTLSRADGWFENQVAGKADPEALREYGIRGSLLFKPSDTAEFILRASTSYSNPYAHGILAEPGPDGIGAGVYALFGLNDYFRTGLGRREIESNYVERRRNRTYALALTGNIDLSDTLTLTSISSWDKGKLFIPEDTDGSPLQVLEIPYTDRAKQISQDLRITSDFSGPLNFILGAYYNDEDVFNRTNFRLFQDIDVNGDGALTGQDCLDGFPVACQVQNSFDQRKKSYAAYSDLRFSLAENLTLRGGLRFTRDTGRLSNFISQALGPDNVVVLNLIPGSTTDLNATTSERYRKSNVSGKIGIDYKTESGTLLYASASRGYRSSAFNAQAFFAPEEVTVADPETLNAYEVGIKGQALDRRLQMTASAFYYDYKNQQFLDLDPNTAAQVLVNLPKARIIGAEFEFIARVSEAFRLSGGVGLLDTKVQEGTLRGTNLDGNELPNAPKVTGTIAADLDLFDTGSGKVTLHGDLSYVSDQWFEIFNVQRLEQNSYTLVNGRLGYRTADERFGVALWAKNVFNKFYYTSRLDLVSGFGYDYNHIGQPRMYGVTADVRF